MGKDVLTRTLTYNDGIERHWLWIFPIVIKSQMPDSRIQVLDEAGLVQADGSRLPPGSFGSFGIHQIPLLSCYQPAAVQELHKVVLEMRVREAVSSRKQHVDCCFFNFFSFANKYSVSKKFWTGKSRWQKPSRHGVHEDKVRLLPPLVFKLKWLFSSFWGFQVQFSWPITSLVSFGSMGIWTWNLCEFPRTMNG